MFRRLRDFLFGDVPPAPALRNKAGGLAFIRGIEELEGRVVTTIRVSHADFWMIDPPQVYRVERGPIESSSGYIARTGDTVRSIAIVDRCLEPIPSVGDEEPSEERLFQPALPACRQGSPA